MRVSAVYVSEKDNGMKYEGDVIIPYKIVIDDTEYYVRGIGDEAFKDCNLLTSITIEGCMDFIGNYAFKNCTGLTEITLPQYWNDTEYEGYIDIGYGAFQGCHLRSLICKLANPYMYSYDNPSYHYHGSTLISQPDSPDWFDGGWLASGDWVHLSDYTTLYVPVGSLNKYHGKYEDHTGDESYWNEFFDDNIKEWGVEEDDIVPELYERTYFCKKLLAQLQDSIELWSEEIFRVCFDSIMYDEQGNVVESLLPLIDKYFAKELKQIEGSEEEVVIMIDKSLKSYIDNFYYSINQIEDALEEMQENRIAYYKARRSNNDNVADKIKKESLIVKEEEIKQKLLDLEVSLAYLFDFNPLVYRIAEIKADITNVPSVATEILQKKNWFTIDGKKTQKPVSPGLYIIGHKKILIY